MLISFIFFAGPLAHFFQQCRLSVLIISKCLNDLLPMLIISTDQYHILQWSLGQAFFNNADYQFISTGQYHILQCLSFNNAKYQYWSISNTSMPFFNTADNQYSGQYQILQCIFFNNADYQYWLVSYGLWRHKTGHRGFPTKRVSNQSTQLQRLATKLKFHL